MTPETQPEGLRLWHRQLFPEWPNDSPFVRGKKNSSGWNIASQLWAARDRALAERATGPWRGGSWPTVHVPIVVYLPQVGHGACLGCTWLGAGGGIDEAAAEAVAHVRAEAGGELPSWSRVVLAVPVFARNATGDQPVSDWSAAWKVAQ